MYRLASTDGETEVQRGGATGPKSHRQSLPGPESRLPGPISSETLCFKKDGVGHRLESHCLGWKESGGTGCSERREGRGAIPNIREERPEGLRARAPRMGQRTQGLSGSGGPWERRPCHWSSHMKEGVTAVVSLPVKRCESPGPSQFRRKEEW